MKAVFRGGKYDGQEMPVDRIWGFAVGATENYGELRARGIRSVPREELDDQPIVNGYVGPMWNGGSLLYESYEYHRAFC